MTPEQIAYAYGCVATRAHRRGMRQADADDVAQYVLMRLAATWHGYDPARSHWRTYISMRVSSLMADAWRRWQGRSDNALSLDAPDAPEMPDAPTVSEAIDSIPDERCRMVARLRYDGYEPERVRVMMRLTDDEYEDAMETIREWLK